VPSKLRSGTLLLAILLLLAIVAVAAVPSIRWRVQVMGLFAAGKIPDVELGDMLRWVRPGSEQMTPRLIATRNPHAVIKNARTRPADIAAGAALFSATCAKCHSPDGSGGPGAPALVGRPYTHGSSDWAVYRTIHLGVPNTAMAAHPYSPDQLWQLVAFVRSLGHAGSDSAGPASVVTGDFAVSAQELRATQEPGADWLTYSGSYSSHRHSSLKQITRENVHGLALRWQLQIPDDQTRIKATPLVKNGIMFITVPPARVMAIEASTGRVLWQDQYDASKEAAGGEFGAPFNRGVALLGDKVFMGAEDGHVIAWSASTGKRLWNIATTTEPKVYYISSAPLAVRDMVIVGVGTKNVGRGFIVALDAATGQERWRFHAIPAPGEPGNETWAGDSWRKGGAPTWLTGSYDPELDLLYWGVGNPKPDYDAHLRAGDNLYSNSIVALEASTGKLRWHFQFTPADDHDWDSNQIPVLMDRAEGGKTTRLLLTANRNGFYYVLDRERGTFLGGVPFVEQSWATGLDTAGRPILAKQQAGSHEGSLLYPGVIGGTNWWSPALDAKRELFFVPFLEQGMVYYNSRGSWPTATSRPFYTGVRALDARTGRRVWEHRSPDRTVHNEMAGLLATAGDLVFGGDFTTFFALDAETGRKLWSVETGWAIGPAPATFETGGEQFVFIASGRSLMCFALPRKA
jgi:alcohol dehydrogenase (cytochrome c)